MRAAATAGGARQQSWHRAAAVCRRPSVPLNGCGGTLPAGGQGVELVNIGRSRQSRQSNQLRQRDAPAAPMRSCRPAPTGTTLCCSPGPGGAPCWWACQESSESMQRSSESATFGAAAGERCPGWLWLGRRAAAVKRSAHRSLRCCPYMCTCQRSGRVHNALWPPGTPFAGSLSRSLFLAARRPRPRRSPACRPPPALQPCRRFLAPIPNLRDLSP